MIAYLDSSVPVRLVFGQKSAFNRWGDWEQAYTSSLLNVECRRVIDRLRLANVLDDHGVAHAARLVQQLTRQTSRVILSPAILSRAALPMPTVVKTLGAIHLATALALRERRHPDLTFVYTRQTAGPGGPSAGIRLPRLTSSELDAKFQRH